MKRISGTWALAGLLLSACLAVATPSARAQGFGFSYAQPGFAIGVGAGGVGYYGAPITAAPIPSSRRPP